MGPGSEHLEADDQLHLRILRAGVLVIGPSWNARNVRSDYWRWYWNGSPGAAVRLADGGLFAIPPRRLVLLPAGMLFSCVCTEEVHHFFIHFEILGLPAPLLAQAFPGPFAATPAVDVRQAIERLQELAAGAGDGQVLRCELKSVLFRSLAVAFAGLPAATRGRLRTSTDDRLRPALRAIADDLGGDLSNPRLAALCALGVSAFERHFRRQLGESPARHVLGRRLETAAQRLLFGGERIEAIASGLGFPDRYYFTRRFSRRFGLGPAAFRRRGVV